MGASYYKNEANKLLGIEYNSKRARRHFEDLSSTLKYLINEKNIRDKDIVDLYNSLQENKDKILILNKYVSKEE